ncbi:hypothetical protein BB560_003010 [Smittium megazygosporum]|uniref:Uncharacterized protein n=1 Tax=Smittium megazygosporum TaxID=133381 RepID=A0A2T9ZD47_9FUNG|nr:hypothetical protein BB560_003010 [Smittium megazygosporum]
MIHHPDSLESVKTSDSGTSGRKLFSFHVCRFSFHHKRFSSAESVIVTVAVQLFVSFRTEFFSSSKRLSLFDIGGQDLEGHRARVDFYSQMFDVRIVAASDNNILIVLANRIRVSSESISGSETNELRMFVFSSSGNGEQKKSSGIDGRACSSLGKACSYRIGCLVEMNLSSIPTSLSIFFKDDNVFTFCNNSAMILSNSELS